MNLYEILEVKPNATEIQIKKAYHRLALLYHPDKNKSPNANEKFQNIQYAYQILSNQKTRNDYCKLNKNDQSKFVDLLQKIFKNNLAIDDLNSFGIKFSINDWDYLEKNFMNLINSLNFNEMLDLFRLGKVPKKTFDIESSDIEDILPEYYFNLPLNYQRINELDIRINLDIKINNLIDENKRKIKIKRNINNNIETNTLIFDEIKPYIVFPLLGDSNENNCGNLIIKLNLPNNYYWQDGDDDTHLILIEQPMTLYEMIYGIDINMNNINIPKWIPSRDGFFIEINQLQQKKIRIAIKLILNYNHSEDKEKILFDYFN